MLAGAVRAAPVADPLVRPALPTRESLKSVLLDVTKAGPRFVAVGERGIVVLSDDAGKTWRQARVPTAVSLTAVAFATPKQGWAVGHSGTVLHSDDGGETWTRQLDGVQAARLVLEAAQARASARPSDPAAQGLLAEARQLVQDGPDKPFLALHFESEREGWIAGAYGLFLHTEDGGKTWQSWMDRLDNPRGLHLYAIRVDGSNLYLAGEQGLFLRSSDRGASFRRLETPYKGTYFAIGSVPTGELVLLGLRGNAYWSGDQGKTFSKVDVPIPVSFSGVATLADGTLVFANQAGNLLASRDRGRTLKPLGTPPLPPLAALTPAGDGSVMTVGVGGAISLPLTGMSPATTSGATR
ncbi:MAG: glycosyl hydrolase [Deltaproteobacteria bacterium]|nr:glycosyl hydrolase [Deltaproteobacteria bacterium]